jgi:hypothetical protein
MIQHSITPQDVVDVLNRAVRADRDAMHNLIEAHVPCNAVLADDPTIQVSGYNEQTGEPTPDRFKVGLLGVLNGLFGSDDQGWGCITANFEVLCPNGHSMVEGAVGDPCPGCRAEGNTVKLVLGKLINFYVDEQRLGAEATDAS